MSRTVGPRSRTGAATFSACRRRASTRSPMSNGDRADAEHVVICVHGLTRQGRDFDQLAAHLATLGMPRHLSGPGRAGAKRPASRPAGLRPAAVLFGHERADRAQRRRPVDWVGTSLGGLIGLALAGFPGHPIRRLVINDIGRWCRPAGLQRIGQYVAEMPTSFDTLEDAERYLRKVLAPFGNLEDEHWRHFTRHSVRLDPADGTLSHLVRSGDHARVPNSRRIPRAPIFGTTGMPSMFPSWSSADANPTPAGLHRPGDGAPQSAHAVARSARLRACTNIDDPRPD